jgi:ABC-type transport system involved in multi-copper enzyme maturation permease subunit
MIWMTWRQFRGQAITAGAVLLAVAIALGITGEGLASDFNGAGLNSCHASCAQDATNFLNGLRGGSYQMLFYGGIAVMYLTPALIGLFWGAPLIARELETGTYRLAWNQSVTRSRWTLIKLGVGGLSSVAAAGLISLMITWWASPIDSAQAYGGSGPSPVGNRMEPLVFAARGVAPLGYAAFAFALGVTLGVVVRRTIPAMALTLVLFVAIQVLMPTLIRPHLLPPERVTAPYNPTRAGELVITNGGKMILVETAGIPGAWILSNVTIDPAGKVFSGPATSACTGPNSNACNSWLDSKHLRQLLTYQPATRFWPLQWTETALYLVASAALGWVCFWQVRRKRA